MLLWFQQSKPIIKGVSITPDYISLPTHKPEDIVILNIHHFKFINLKSENKYCNVETEIRALYLRKTKFPRRFDITEILLIPHGYKT